MSENIDYQKRQEKVLAWLKAKGKPEPKTWNYHQADDGRYYIYETEKKKRYGKVKSCNYCNYNFLSIRGYSFCNDLCTKFSKIKKVEVKCAYCTKIVLRVPSDLNKSIHGIYFCSRVCKDSAQKMSDNILFRKTLYSRHPIVPNKKQYHKHDRYQKYNLNSNLKCLDCDLKAPAILDIHHIDKNNENNNIENLEILCKNHHIIRHLSNDFMARNYNHITPRKLLPKINIYQKLIKNNIHKVSDGDDNFKDMVEKDFPNKKEIQKNNEGSYFVEKSTGKKRYGELTKCSRCKDAYIKTKTDKSIFCSQYCKRLFIQKDIYKEYQCAHCTKMFLRNMNKVRSELVFCNSKCQSEASKKGGVLVKAHYNEEECKYREKAFKYLNHKCSDCDVCFEPILDVHHKDGNDQNNDIENLEILCPNHHATRHMRQDDKGEWLYSTKSLTPRDKLEEVKKDLGI